jgi:superfamily II DNA or RNA helicase
MEHNQITVSHYNDVYMKVDCERGIAKEISEFFTFKVPNYQFTPAYKNKIWDGQIRLFNTYRQTLYVGLKDYLIHFASERDYPIINEVKDYGNVVTTKKIIDYMKNYLKIPFAPYDHQIVAIKHAIENSRTLLLSPTGSGKSLIIYTLMRYYLDTLPEDKKILIIVPTVGLVSQMKSDFEDYSKGLEWSVNDLCHPIFSGQSKSTSKKIIISTWQSLHKENEEYFKQFGAVFGDECHLFKAKSLTNIMTKLVECPFRIGTTGTLDGSTTHKLVIEGLFGRVFNVTTTKELMDENLLSNLSIDCLTLKYGDDEIKEIKRAKYDEEIKWLIRNEKRNNLIIDLVSNIKGNTLILFNYVKEHGVPLHENISKRNEDVYMIHGGTTLEQREKIRKIVDEKTNATLVASYGTCSTGINIRNINNIIFASPSRSVIRVLQSIGRGLRRTDDKNKVKLYDISDDLRYLKYDNHTYRHLQERIKIYNKEKFSFKQIEIDVGEKQI